MDSQLPIRSLDYTVIFAPIRRPPAAAMVMGSISLALRP